MDNLEIIFRDIETLSISPILKKLCFDSKNIRSSHFHKDDKDMEYSEIGDLREYFSESRTGNIFVKSLDIGINIFDIMIILSFDEKYGDMTLNFQEENVLKGGIIDSEKENLIKNKLEEILLNTKIGSVVFGFEPAEDEDMMIFKLNK